jgi:DNA polymerase I-like protein with 3'-5' exonuclease and polymerase domains
LNRDLKQLLTLLIRLGEITTNYTSFIKKFPNIAEKRTTGHYIHGDIKLCGTLSGRCSGGGDVNLLALPSTGSVLAKPVKQIMTSPKGRIVVTADYSGQEDYCASVVSKDQRMLDGKELGRDGHSERALAYFPELLTKHVALIKNAESSPKGTKYYFDDSQCGLDRLTIEEK